LNGKMHKFQIQMLILEITNDGNFMIYHLLGTFDFLSKFWNNGK